MNRQTKPHTNTLNRETANKQKAPRAPPIKKINVGGLNDDFYSNLLDWSTKSTILIGGNHKLYRYSFFENKIEQVKNSRETITCVKNFIALKNDNNVEQKDNLKAKMQRKKMINFNNFYTDSRTFDSSLAIDDYSEFCSDEFSMSSEETDIRPRKLDTIKPKVGSKVFGFDKVQNYVYGSISGTVVVLDPETFKSTTFKNHHGRVGAIEQLDNNTFLSGSRDRSVRLNDIRSNCSRIVFKHDQEVCGIKANRNNWLIATGGNDNKVAVNDMRSWNNDKNITKFKNKMAKPNLSVTRAQEYEQTFTSSITGSVDGLSERYNVEGVSPATLSPRFFSNYTIDSFSTDSSNLEDSSFIGLYPTLDNTVPILSEQHQAAVKALSWSDHNILASGGGTADKNIKLWCLNSRTLFKSKNMNSQVCNLKFVYKKGENTKHSFDLFDNSCSYISYRDQEKTNIYSNSWNNRREALVSTHGYSQNDARISDIELEQSAGYHGHMNRVVYMGIDETNNFMVTGGNDDHIYIWNIGQTYK